MIRSFLLAALLTMAFTTSAGAQMDFEVDSFETNSGNLEIAFIGHGTLMFKHDGKVIHVDPWTGLADYSKLPGSVEIAYEFLRKIPECAEYYDLILQANESVRNKEYEKAEALLDAAIDACRRTMSLLNLPAQEKKSPDTSFCLRRATPRTAAITPKTSSSCTSSGGTPPIPRSGAAGSASTRAIFSLVDCHPVLR